MQVGNDGAGTWSGERWRLTVDGKVVAENIPGGTIYPRHFWYGGYVDKNDGVAILETTIESDKEKDVDAWIDMTGFSRSEGRCNDGIKLTLPKRGGWKWIGTFLPLDS